VSTFESPRGEAVTLAALGFDARVEALFASLPQQGVPGRVARVDRGSSTVLLERETARAELNQDLQRLAILGDAAALPAAGDWVAVTRRPGHALDVIEAILPRTSAFIRRAPEAGGDSSTRNRPQVLAANVDVAFLVAAATDTRAGRLERIGIVAWESGATPVIVLTKADLVADPSSAFRTAEEALPGVPVHLVDSVHGEGLDALRQYLRADADAGGGYRTAVVLGASGVGKSTLANALVGEDVLETGDVREVDGRGRHTTTARHLVALPGGGALIDTPGIRSIAAWGASEGIDLVFAEIEALASECRFRDCAHLQEPDCAVQAAIAAGEVDAKRLERYRRVQRERAREEAKGDPLAQADLVAGRKRINRWLRGRDDLRRKRGT
jgi:ribosome biogenesis GTPase